VLGAARPARRRRGRQLPRPGPRPLGDLLAAAEADPGAPGAREIEIGEERVLGGDAERSDEPSEDAGELRRDRRVAQPRGGRGVVGQRVGVDHGHDRHRDAVARLSAGHATRRRPFTDHDDRLGGVAGVAADDVPAGRRAEPARELPLDEAEAALFRRQSVPVALSTRRALLDGLSGTTGLSISPRRSIRRFH
jgi:hypothetical protein